MGKSPGFENDFLKLILQAVAIANLADNASSGPITSVYVSLHTADPSGQNNQTQSECAYGSYARVAVARTAGGWAVVGNVVSPVVNIVFPQATSGTETATFAGIGRDISGAGRLFWSGAISPTIAISVGITPTLGTASTITET